MGAKGCVGPGGEGQRRPEQPAQPTLPCKPLRSPHSEPSSGPSARQGVIQTTSRPRPGPTWMEKVSESRYIQPTKKETTTVMMMPRGPLRPALTVSSVRCAEAS